MSLGHEHGLVLIGLAGPMDAVNLSLSLILCYCSEVGSVLGTTAALQSMEPNAAEVLGNSAWCPGAHQDIACEGRVQAISSACYMAVTGRQILAAAEVPLFRQATD